MSLRYTHFVPKPAPWCVRLPEDSDAHAHGVTPQGGSPATPHFELELSSS